MVDTQALGDRAAELLDRLTADDDNSAKAVEELVHSLSAMYGEALRRILTLVDDETRHRLAEDELVAGLLLVHDLHPDDMETRVLRALDAVRPALGLHRGGVELLGIDGDGAVRLRLEGSCHGCPSSQVTVRNAIEQAVLVAAPDCAGVVVEGMVESSSAETLLQIEPRPNAPAYASDGTECPAVVGAAS